MRLADLVSRHLPEGGLVLVLGPQDVVDALAALTGKVTTEPTAADLVVVDAGDASEAVAAARSAAPAAPVVLLLETPLAELPVGRVAALGSTAGLGYVDAVPLSGRHTAAVVAAPDGVAPRARLTGQQVEGDPDAGAARRTWEWGLAGLVTPAREARWEAEHRSLTNRVSAAERARAEAEERARQAQRRAAEVEKRLARVEGSLALQVGRDLVSMRRHPIMGIRALVRDARSARRQRRAG